MASVHFETATACLVKNIELLGGASSEVKPENIPLWNISNALLALTDALQDEFVTINSRLTYIELLLNR